MAVESTTLTAVKLALNVTVSDYDNEISDLIDAALLDLNTDGYTNYGGESDGTG